MAFFRRWFLILFALMLGGGPAFAASREDRAYAAAVLAFHDQFYSLAQIRLAQYLQTYRKSTNAPAAALLLAQSEFYLKNYSAVTNRLADPVNLAKARAAGLADRYVYWRAEAEYAAGDFTGAAQTFVSVAEGYPDSPLALGSVVEAAAAYEKLNQWPQVDDLLGNPNGFFQRQAQLDPADEQVANGRLLLAESKCEQQNFADAIQVLSLMNPAALTREQDWKRAHLLYRANLGKNDLDEALAATTNLVGIARSGQGDGWPTNLAESVVCNSTVLEKLGRLADAATALQENLSATAPVDQQQQAILKLSDLALAQQNLASAEMSLDNFLTRFPDSPAAGIARLTLGELHLKDYIAQPAAIYHLVAAQTNLLAAPTNGPLAGKVFLGRGWCDWLAATNAGSMGDVNTVLQKTFDSFLDFQSAAQLLPLSDDMAVARFKMGDAQFALGDFSGAQTNYRAVLTDFSTLPRVTNSLTSAALYQILRAQILLTNVAGMDDTMRQLLAKFFTSAPADSGLLLAGEGFADFDSPVKARQVFHGFEIERGDSPLMPQVAFAAARTYEREQNWAAAVTNYEAWLKAYPANDFQSQVEYARNWAVAQTGDEAGAFVLFTNFVTQYTNTTLTPLAYWWVADHYFKLGTSFDQAEKYYEFIFQYFPTNELAYRAQLMAGRAALGRSGYPDAGKYFLSLIDANCPGDIKDKARFAYCETLLRQINSADTNSYVNLQQATNILAQMYPEATTNLAGALAWCETGDCDFQLGALDAATNAYAQALNSPAADSALRNEAQVGLGIVLEKKAEGLSAEAQRPLLSLALNNYTAVLYTTNLVADAFWTKKAGLQALPLIMTLKEGNVDLFFDRLEYWLPQLKDSLEKKRVALKS